MVAKRSTLEDVGAGLSAGSLDLAALTGPQSAWLSMGSPLDPEADGRPLLWLGANQIGKSFAQAAKVLHFVRATGPYARRKPGAVRVAVISISKEQIEPLMGKIWDLLPKGVNSKGDLVALEAPDLRFEPGFGFRGKPPRIKFTSGPGKGSVVIFATYQQGSSRIAGLTADVVLLDEPPPESMWGEVCLRVMRLSGQIWITMTITPDSPPQDWLRTKVDSGQIRFMQTALTAINVKPPGLPPFLSAAKIAAMRAQVPDAERPLRFDAAWEGATVEQWLSAWSGELVGPCRPPSGARLIVAGDHGIRPGRQGAALIAYVLTPVPRYWLLGEVCCDPSNLKPTTSKEDAQNVKNMLDVWGYSWNHIDDWVFDRAADAYRQEVKKSNKLLRLHLAEVYGVEQDRFPRLEVPYKTGGSFLQGFSLLNSIFCARQITVDPRCVGFVRSCQKWNGDKRSPLKDILDSVRYGLENTTKTKPTSVVSLQKTR
jgi:hypothetical protein